MKIDVISNFDFDKLSKTWTNKIKPDLVENVLKDTEKVWKRNILEKHYTPLRKSTVHVRKSRGRGGNKPLFDTGNLYRSIKAKKRVINHAAYGEYHIDGYTTGSTSMIPNKKVPPRKWKDKRFALLRKSTKKKVLRKINSALRRAGRGKIIASF